MKLTVKNLKQQSVVLDVEINISIKDLHNLVCDHFSYPACRLIYSGKILDSTKNLSDYMNENDRGFIVAMRIDNPSQASNNITNVNQSNINPYNVSNPFPFNATNVTNSFDLNSVSNVLNSSSTQAHLNSQPTINNSINANTSASNQNNESNQYSFRQVRAVVIGLLRFIRTNTNLSYIYFSSPVEFHHLILEDTFSDTIRGLLENSNQIADAIDSNANVDIQINNRYGSGGVLGTNSTNTSPTNTNRVNNDLTDADRTNIQTLINLGYTEQQATIVYIMVNRDINLAASLLLDY